MENKTAIIMIGDGLRMRPLTEDKPKCMVTIKGKPILDYQLKLLEKHNFERVVFVYPEGYAKMASIRDYVSKFSDINFDYVEQTNMGNAGGVWCVLQEFPNLETFIVMDYDVITDTNLTEFWSAGDNVYLCVKAYSKYSTIEFDSEMNITRCEEKPIIKKWVNGGIYKFHRKDFPEGVNMNDVYNRVKAKAHIHPTLWVTVDTIKEVVQLEQDIAEGKIDLEIE